MEFNTIVEKTKRMLGKNYRGDTELVPVYSTLTPIEGHTDSFLAIANNGFTNEEIALIEEKIKNYSWWVANKGYLVNTTSMAEVSALFIYGSEEGSATPDVLNFNGTVTNDFYNSINRTDITGVVNSSSNHVYVQFLLDEETQEFETDTEGTPTTLTINDVIYNVYAGRLYEEDKVVIDNNVVYPIYLVSNLDYYYIPTEGEEGELLTGAHDTELVEQSNLEILEDVCEMVVHETAQWTNRLVNDALLTECWPVIVKCACVAYLNRGAEGLSSQTELGQQNVYNDWIALLHNQVTNRRYVI